MHRCDSVAWLPAGTSELSTLEEGHDRKEEQTARRRCNGMLLMLKTGFFSIC